ncbi:MAG: hypothetical protein SCARUB_01653 [Candidatus Scalindua rubra]|uniref:Uncharacterized protein n=1 Tax=Candidatus Scalindua rubra TaxID=1872076 RepID=A0A1E3XC16_9BACT|nr:MAG: hypothetical protein SCARUB_01653 [Candidatus Scalindua rubra]
MNKFRLNKTLLSISLCICILIGAKSAFADSIRVDVGATQVPGFIRYCFQVINDDQNEPNPKHHVEHIALLTLKYISKDATSADHLFRDNVTGPDLWDSKVTIHGKDQKITWTFDGYFGSKTTKYTVEKPDQTIKPGNRSSIFSFVVNGEISVTEFETGFQESPGSYRSVCKTPYPFGEVFLTNDNDTDFLRDKDGDGVADIYDDDPDRTK